MLVIPILAISIWSKTCRLSNEHIKKCPSQSLLCAQVIIFILAALTILTVFLGEFFFRTLIELLVSYTFFFLRHFALGI